MKRGEWYKVREAIVAAAHAIKNGDLMEGEEDNIYSVNRRVYQKLSEEFGWDKLITESENEH